MLSIICRCLAIICASRLSCFVADGVCVKAGTVPSFIFVSVVVLEHSRHRRVY